MTTVTLATAPAQAGVPCTAVYTQKQHQHYARAIYKRRAMTLAALHHNLVMRRCQVGGQDAVGNALSMTRRFRRQRRQRSRLLLLLPYSCGAHGRFSIPCYIVGRESRFNPRAKNPSSSAGGYYQIINNTWWGAGGSKNSCYHVAACAPVEEQHRVARRLWNGGAGVSHWRLTA